jgi:exonuclease SbcC
MIKSAYIEFFQGHVNSFLEFSKGVNTITGTSDSGKSAIIKAINWYKDNRPSGDSFKNWDAREQDQVAVEICTEKDAGAIIRENGKTKYVLNGVDFDVVQTDVPSEISDSLNLADYNVQGQFSSYFLLQDSPGEVARKLNEYADMEEVDILFSNLDSEIRTTNKKITDLKKEISEHTSNLNNFKNLKEIEKIIENISKEYEKSLGIDASLKVLTEIVITLESINKEREEANSLVMLDDQVSGIFSRINEVDILSSKENSLKNIVKDLDDLKQEKEIDLLYLDIEKQNNALLEKLKERDKIVVGIENLASLIQKLEYEKKQKTTEMENVATIKKNYISLLSEVKICPVCSTNITNKIITKISEVL